jgi:hypothetical protein
MKRSASGSRERVEGLQDVVGGALLHGLDRGLHVDHARDHHDLLLGIALLHALHELGAVDLRHHQVREDHVEVLALEDVQRLLAAGRGPDLVALSRQQALDQLAEVALVVDRQDAGLGHRTSPPRRPGGAARAQASLVWSRSPRRG